jgi:apolipoprotein N-acyltransferase
MFGVGVSWVYVAIHDFGQASVFVAGLLTTLFVSFLASYLAGLGWLLRRYAASTNPVLNVTVLFPVAWLIFEWFKSWFLTGFPWLEVGVGQLNSPLSGFTPIIGTAGVSLLTAVSAGMLVACVMTWRWWWGIAFAVVWLSGAQLKQVDWTSPSGAPIQVSIIQGNIPQAIKWDKDQLFKTLALYQARTEENWQSDLIVWPENAVTVFHHQAKEFFLDPLAELARENETDILLGLPVLDRETDQYYNSMMSLGQNEQFYFKKHLVPFGDYVPLSWLRGLIAFFDLPMSGFEPGPEKQALFEAANQKIGISICYEDVFSNEVLPTASQSTLLVNATNNAWYGNSFAPHQHLQISQNRALEMGRPIIRATTNGISAFIEPNGLIHYQTNQFEEAVLTSQIQPRQGETPYVTWGRWPVAVLSLFMLSFWAYHRRIVMSKKS